MKFGEYLVNNNLIQAFELEEALSIQKAHKQTKIGRLLVELEYLSRKELDIALTGFFSPYLKIEAKEIGKTVAGIVARKVIRDSLKEHNAIFYKETDSTIEILTKSYSDFLAERIELLTGKNATTWIINEETFSFLASTNDDVEDNRKIFVSRALSDDEKLNEDTPYTKIIKEAVLNAKEKGVSDIHVVPIFQGIGIYFRLHGHIRLWKKFSNEHKEPLTNKLKSIVNMDLGVVGRPQDSRASFKELFLNLRANSLPVLYGEKLVLRLLDQSKSFELSNTGLPSNTLKDIKSSLRLREGLILISGPTGSGKTSTLYSMLCELDRERQNISTLENPVEYELEGISQVNISDENKNLTFGSALRALMRQDPDKILIGEIRDQETAELAIKAASTGHLVLSTVHANSATEVIQRFLTFGVDEFSLKSVLRFSAAQRLVPKLCTKCTLDAPTDLLRELNMTDTSTNLKVTNSEGCNSCDEGTVGMIPILEYMQAEQVQAYFNGDRDSSSSLVTSLKAECLKVAKAGLTDANLILEIS